MILTNWMHKMNSKLGFAIYIKLVALKMDINDSKTETFTIFYWREAFEKFELRTYRFCNG